MNATWLKVVGDLRDSPARMTLVALAVLVGTVAMGTVFGARAILTREVEDSFLGTNPPSAVLWLERVDEAVIHKAKSHPGVEAAEPRRLVRARIEVAPGEWRPLRLYAVHDFNDLRVSTFSRVSGDWPPNDGEVLVERSALPILHAGQGDNIHVRLPSGKVVGLHVGGIVHDAGQVPGWMDQVAYAYCTVATMRELGLGDDFDELRIVTGGDPDRASMVASELADILRETGRSVHRVEVPLREHPHADHMGSMLAVFQVFSALALLLSGAMAANVMAALMAKQVRQIGVMKTIGATSRQVTAVYLRLVCLLALLAVAVGIPNSAWMAGQFAVFLADHLNLSISNTSIPWWLIVIQGAIAIGVPLAATAIAVRRAARMTAREAVSHHGIVAAFTSGRWSSSLGGWASDRALALALRNTFRRPARLISTVGTLALGGAVIMTAANVYSSLNAGLDATLTAQGHDIDVRLLKPVDGEPLARNMGEVAGVTGVETWGMTLAALEKPGAGSTSVSTGRYSLLAPPANTRFLNVPLVKGRWPQLGESDAVVVNRTLADKERLVHFGGQVVLVSAGRRLVVHVVGIVEEIAPPTLYTNATTLAALTGTADQAAAFRVTTRAGAEQDVAAKLEELLATQGSLPTLLMTRNEFRASLLDHFQIIVICLVAAGAAAVIVGGLSVFTTMSINVLERSREIGIARAIGATQWVVTKLLLTEGVALAALCVGIGVLLSLPLSAGLTILIGNIGPHVRLPFVVSIPAVADWAVITAGVTITACLLAARRALVLPVREVLAYE